jgi:hypothetical protein
MFVNDKKAAWVKEKYFTHPAKLKGFKMMMNRIILGCYTSLVCFLILVSGCVEKRGDGMDIDTLLSKLPEETVMEIKTTLGEDAKELELFWYDGSSDFYSWLENGKILTILNQEKKQVVFYFDEGHYCRINSTGALQCLNMALSNMTFSIHDFSDSFKTNTLIKTITNMYSTQKSYFLTKQYTESIANLLKEEKAKIQDFHSLAKHSVGITPDGHWKAEFNSFNIDGSVDSWRITGHCDQSDKLTIMNIDVVEIRKKGSYESHLFFLGAATGGLHKIDKESIINRNGYTFNRGLRVCETKRITAVGTAHPTVGPGLICRPLRGLGREREGERFSAPTA